MEIAGCIQCNAAYILFVLAQNFEVRASVLKMFLLLVIMSAGCCRDGIHYALHLYLVYPQWNEPDTDSLWTDTGDRYFLAC